MEKNKNNKILIIILIIFIIGLILMNFILSEPKYEITIEIIICLCLLVILSLSEMFDNLSIPKVISLSKNIKEVKRENDNLKETNIRLIEQITSIKNSNSQNIYLRDSFRTISSSNIEDINKNMDQDQLNEQEDSDTIIEQEFKDNHTNYRNTMAERRKYRQNIEVFMLQKVLYLDNKKLDNIEYDVKLINNKFIDDNIMKNEARFDALKSSNTENVFYEVKTSPIFFDYPYQLHYMLRTLELYKEFSKTPCKLILVLPILDEELEKIMYNLRGRFAVVKDRISNRFKPAIENNLLEIIEVNVSKSELDKYINEKEKN